MSSLSHTGHNREGRQGQHQDSSPSLREDLADLSLLDAARRANHRYVTRRVIADKSSSHIFKTRDPIYGQITFDLSSPLGRLCKALVDTKAMQRLKRVAEITSADFVFIGLSTNRFVHSVGTAYLALETTKNLKEASQRFDRTQVEQYQPAVVAAALLHDVGHVAPRSHLAENIFWRIPEKAHERISSRIIREDKEIRLAVAAFVGDSYEFSSRAINEFIETVAGIIDPASAQVEVPRWCIQLISGEGWNCDRGDWCNRDSERAGVHYGRYDWNTLALNLTLANDKLAIKKGGVEPLKAFMMRRIDMYNQVYSHAVAIIAAKLMELVVRRARELQQSGNLEFADGIMKKVLQRGDPSVLSLEEIYQMTESWWGYHLEQWTKSADSILSDLAHRVLYRRLFKPFPNTEENLKLLKRLLEQKQLPSKWYLLEVERRTKKLSDDLKKEALPVVVGRGKTKSLAEVLKAQGELVDLVVDKPPLLAVPEDIFPADSSKILSYIPERIH